MSILAKRRVVWIGLVVFAVWPLVHYGLVRTTDLSAWKAFGWAMYCVPGRAVMVRVDSLDDGTPLTINKPRLRTVEFMTVFNDFVKRRKAIGAWAKPDQFASVLLDEFPNVQGIEVVVDQVGIDRSTGMAVVERTDRYPYRREPASDR